MAVKVFCPAGDVYKKLRGGAFAICAADNLASARGTLTTESDPSSVAGVVVRDTQQVNSILANSNTAYQAADDTIDLSGIPLVNNREYHIWATFKTEGYTDLTDGALLRVHFNENWIAAGISGSHFNVETSNVRFAAVQPPMPFYRAINYGSLVYQTGNSPKIRFAAESGTSIEFLIDQIFLFPVINNKSSNFPHAANTTLGLDADTQDGLDGGDDNSKFTWFVNEPVDSWSSRGDYQRYADGDDAEYFSQVTVPDGLTFWFSPFGTEDGKAHMYSLHTALHRGERVWTDDTFTNRNTSGTDQDMGITPEGFGYSIGSSSSATPNKAFVNGAGSAFMQIRHHLGTLNIDMGSPSVGSSAIQNQGMKFQLYDQWSWDVIFQWVQGTPGLYFDPMLGFFQLSPLFQSPVLSPYVEFIFGEGVWRAGNPGISGSGSDHDISGWFDVGAMVGVRMEQKRHLFRMKVWDASGSEPSTWDEEFYLYDALHADPYPYSDIESRSSSMMAAACLDLQANLVLTDNDYLVGADDPLNIRFDKWTVEHNPYGDSASMYVRTERPVGTVLDDVEIPFGSSYFVYWGQRDWTDDDGTGDNYLEFSTKVWNDPSAAEIQRAEVDDYYFYYLLERGPIDLSKIRYRAYGAGDIET